MVSTLLMLAVLGQISGPPDPREAFGQKPEPRVVVQAPAPKVEKPAIAADGWPQPPIRVFLKSQGPLEPPVRHSVKITDVPVHISQLYEAAAVALADEEFIPENRQYEARFIAAWPVQSSEHANLEKALNFWVASMNNRRKFVPLTRVPNLGWMLYLSDYDWQPEAWDALTAKSLYFRVSTYDKHGQLQRGWIDPEIEYVVRDATDASRPIELGIRFLGLTGLDIGDPRGGVYSKFLKLPNSEAQLFKQFGIDEAFIKENDLLRGGAVLGGASGVAQHNRELQLLPSPIGLDESYLWRSLDMGSDLGDQSVIQNFAGTVRIDGGEYIGTLKDGLHWYYLVNKKKAQVNEVPINIAQDRDDPHDAVVHTPYKCVKCHGPKGGIRHFDDVVARMALNPNVALSVIQKYKDKHHDQKIDNATRLALEDYYLSPLAQDINEHQESYTRVVQEITGLSPAANTANYLKFVNSYLWGLVDRDEAAYMLGVEVEQLDAYLKQTGNEELMAILASEAIPRALFEQGFADGMKARIYPWERSPIRERKPEHQPSRAPVESSPPAHAKNPPQPAKPHAATQQPVHRQPVPVQRNYAPARRSFGWRR